MTTTTTIPVHEVDRLPVVLVCEQFVVPGAQIHYHKNGQVSLILQEVEECPLADMPLDVMTKLRNSFFVQSFCIIFMLRACGYYNADSELLGYVGEKAPRLHPALTRPTNWGFRRQTRQHRRPTKHRRLRVFEDDERDNYYFERLVVSLEADDEDQLDKIRQLIRHQCAGSFDEEFVMLWEHLLDCCASWQEPAWGAFVHVLRFHEVAPHFA